MVSEKQRIACSPACQKGWLPGGRVGLMGPPFGSQGGSPADRAPGCQISEITAPWPSRRSLRTLSSHLGQGQGHDSGVGVGVLLAGYLGSSASPFGCPLPSRRSSRSLLSRTPPTTYSESVLNLISTKNLEKPTELKLTQLEPAINQRDPRFLLGHVCPPLTNLPGPGFSPLQHRRSYPISLEFHPALAVHARRGARIYLAQAATYRE